MRGVLFAIGAALAFGVTAGLAFLAMQSEPEDRPSEPVAAAGASDATLRAPAPRPETALTIRPYETAQTLIEDLRDVLASGPPSKVHAECWRVSKRLERSAAWMVGTALEREASPRVRALLVLAAGVHVQDEAVLLRGLRDPDARVRRATVLALGYEENGENQELLGVQVPIGRTLPAALQAQLETLKESETDEQVRAAIRAITN